MPNHIINVVTAPKHVIDFMKKDGRVDFRKITPVPEIFGKIENDFYFAAEKLARVVQGLHSELPIERRIEIIKNLNATSLEMKKIASDAVIMIQAYEDCGYYNPNEWARDNWGTKWNAYYQDDNRSDDTTVCFQTAWSLPSPIARKLAEMFPDEITWQWADEDLGSNCGTVVFREGKVVLKEESMLCLTEDYREESGKWNKFAFELWYPGEHRPEFYDESWNYI